MILNMRLWKGAGIYTPVAMWQETVGFLSCYQFQQDDCDGKFEGLVAKKWLTIWCNKTVGETISAICVENLK